MKSRKKVFVVDDDHDILDLLEVFLYKDYDLHLASSGFDALKFADQIIPDCIITDIVMPTMDGIKLFNAMRKKANAQKVPIIAVTSFGGRSHSAKSLRAMGFAVVLKKPVTRSKIIGAIEAATGSA